MLTQDLSRKQVAKLLLTLAALLFLAVLAIDYALLLKDRKSNKQLAKINSWLTDRLTSFADDEFNKIWKRLSQKMISYNDALLKPTDLSQGIAIVHSEAPFTALHEGKFASMKSYWDFKTEKTSLEVNYGFGLFSIPDSLSKTELEAARVDSIKFNSLISQIRTSFLQSKPNPNYTLDEYSDRMLEVFDIKDLVHENFPELRVYSFYVGSSTGAFAIYPASKRSFKNFNPKLRPWFTSALKGEPFSENLSMPGFGLLQVYPDVVSGLPFVRAFWYKTETQGRDYVVALDLFLAISSDYQNPALTLASVKRSLFLALLVAAIPIVIILIMYSTWGNWWNNQAKKILFREIKAGAVFTGTKLIRTYQKYMHFDATEKYETELMEGTREEKRFKVMSWLSVRFARIEHEVNTAKESQRTAKHKEAFRLGEDLSIRGKEHWKLYRREQGQGVCRLCSQNVPYQDEIVDIGDAFITHRSADDPIVDFKPDPRKMQINSQEIDDSIKWQVLQGEFREGGIEYNLEPFPEAKVPSPVLGFQFAKTIIDSYRLLNEGRLHTDDVISLSKEIFRENTVMTICRTEYFRRLVEMGQEGIEILSTGRSIRRILLAETKEELERFLSNQRDAIAKILKLKPAPSIFTAILTDIPRDTIRLYREWDFGLVYIDQIALVIASQVSDHSKSPKIRGYLSWREVDIKFHEVLYSRLDGIAQRLTIEDLGKDKSRPESD